MGVGTLRRYYRFKAQALRTRGEGALAEAFEVKAEAAPCTPLPADFPGHDALIAAGYRCLEDLQGATLEELVAIKGIGRKTGEKILAALGG